MEDKRENDKVEIYSQRVKAGKRTYFFDIKSTRSNDYYLTITESKKVFKDDGHYFEKHKIFIYKEDLMRFSNTLLETIEHLKTELMPDYDFTEDEENEYDAKPYKSELKNESKNESNLDSDFGSDQLKWD